MDLTGVRVFAYNLATDVALAVGVVVYPLVSAGDINWQLVAVAAGKTVVATAVAFCVKWLRDRKVVAQPE